MKTSINKYDFRDAFKIAGRENNFSYHGLGVLFDYFEEYEESTGEEIELDVVAICCEYSEDYCSDIADNYSIDISDCIDEVTTVETVMAYLQDHTSVAGVTEDGTIVYAQF
jgi:hypothetical protein